MVTEERLLAQLRREAQRTNNTELGRQLGFSQSYMSRVLAGHFPVSERLANALGYQRVTRYVRSKG